MQQNLMLPGNPRYQPKSLQEYFGYDNLFRTIAEVELANLNVLNRIGYISQTDFNHLTNLTKQDILNLRTTDIDEIERSITKHDIRAWIYLAKNILPSEIGRYVHLVLTSYDPIETGRSLQYKRAFENTIKPAIKKVILLMAEMVEENANTLEIGRTHRQAALPITIGFWLATVLYRIIYNFQEMDRNASLLVGKISGAVGAHNAQIGLGFQDRCGEKTYEELVLSELGIKPAPISTQILPPEPLAYFLHSCLLTSASFGQFGRDCRNLMSTEIAEISEDFGSKQSGSSTMAHKRNPITFEGLEGDWLKTKNEYGKVLDSLISDLQRDLVGSRLMRDFPTILINLQTQLDALLRKDNKGQPFLKRIKINVDSCEKNFQRVEKVIMSEPLYIALELYGYEGDAHNLVNHKVVPLSQKRGISLVEAVNDLSFEDKSLFKAWRNIPSQIMNLLANPREYTGDAIDRALSIAKMARKIAI